MADMNASWSESIQEQIGIIDALVELFLVGALSTLTVSQLVARCSTTFSCHPPASLVGPRARRPPAYAAARAAVPT